MLCGALDSPYLVLSHPTVALASHIALILTFTLQPLKSLPSPLQKKRLNQSTKSMWNQFRRNLVLRHEENEAIQGLASRLESEMALGKLTPRAAAGLLLNESKQH